MDPLVALEAELLGREQTATDGTLCALVKQVLRPKAAAPVTHWHLDRLLVLIERLVQVTGTRELRTLCYILLYKLAYHLHQHPDLTKDHIDRVLRPLQRQKIGRAHV